MKPAQTSTSTYPQAPKQKRSFEQASIKSQGAATSTQTLKCKRATKQVTNAAQATTSTQTPKHKRATKQVTNAAQAATSTQTPTETPN
jgi:hypothetical protein